MIRQAPPRCSRLTEGNVCITGTCMRAQRRPCMVDNLHLLLRLNCRLSLSKPLTPPPLLPCAHVCTRPWCLVVCCVALPTSYLLSCFLLPVNPLLLLHQRPPPPCSKNQNSPPVSHNLGIAQLPAPIFVSYFIWMFSFSKTSFFLWAWDAVGGPLPVVCVGVFCPRNAEYLAIASESKDNCAGVQVGD